MRASIIIVIYNGLFYLDECLNSLSCETNDDEIILVDNASSDGSARFIKEYWPETQLIINPTNIGFAAACNQGARAACGEYLVFLNQDTQVCPGWLSNLLAPLGQDASIGLTTSKLLLMSEPDRIQMCGQDIHFTGLTFGRGFLCASTAFAEPAKVGAVSGASFAIRRELWQDLGGFDESLFMYYEETDLSWRAMLKGHSSLYVPESVALHDYHPSQPGYLTLFYTMRNRYVLLLKNWRWVTLILLSPSMVLAEMLDWGYSALVGRKGLLAKLRVSGWLVTHIKSILRARKRAQRSRKFPDFILLNRCTDRLNPIEYTGGRAGRMLVSVCNLWFSIHYHLVLTLIQWLKI